LLRGKSGVKQKVWIDWLRTSAVHDRGSNCIITPSNCRFWDFNYQYIVNLTHRPHRLRLVIKIY